jgi:hypothetical protein
MDNAECNTNEYGSHQGLAHGNSYQTHTHTHTQQHTFNLFEGTHVSFKPLCHFTNPQTFTDCLSQAAAMHSTWRSCQPSTAYTPPKPPCIPMRMENFVRTQLRPVDDCVICSEPFSATHQPVALECKHIFGHRCIQIWVENGRGNTASCPVCRHVLVAKRSAQPAFDAPSIWKRLCELSTDRLHSFMEKLWIGIRDLWKWKPDGNFSITELLDKAIFPALIEAGAQAWSGSHDALTDAYNLTAVSWDSLGRPDRAEGLAIPLVRLARLVSSAAATLPLYLTDLSRTTRLIWNANACLGLTEHSISWDCIIDASKLHSDRHLPLLHLYTVLISQSIAHKSGQQQQQVPTRRYEIMNLVVDKCCTKIGKACFVGKPSNAFKDMLVFVFQELWRYQHEQARLSLRGHADEDVIVRGIWGIASWPIKRGR